MKLNFNKKGNAIERRKRVIAYLKKQLKDGVKNATVTTTNWVGITSSKTAEVPLTESDKKRIEKELSVLLTRI